MEVNIIFSPPLHTHMPPPHTTAGECYIINPRRMRSEGYGTWSVCLSVCLSVTAILPPRTIRRLTRGTSGYSATCTRLIKRRFLYKCFIKELGRYLLTAKKSAIFTLVRMCEAILNIDTHDVICKRSLQILILLDKC